MPVRGVCGEDSNCLYFNVHPTLFSSIHCTQQGKQQVASVLVSCWAVMEKRKIQAQNLCLLAYSGPQSNLAKLLVTSIPCGCKGTMLQTPEGFFWSLLPGPRHSLKWSLGEVFRELNMLWDIVKGFQWADIHHLGWFFFTTSTVSSSFSNLKQNNCGMPYCHCILVVGVGEDSSNRIFFSSEDIVRMGL